MSWVSKIDELSMHETLPRRWLVRGGSGITWKRGSLLVGSLSTIVQLVWLVDFQCAWTLHIGTKTSLGILPTDPNTCNIVNANQTLCVVLSFRDIKIFEVQTKYRFNNKGNTCVLEIERARCFRKLFCSTVRAKCSFRVHCNSRCSYQSWIKYFSVGLLHQY